MGNGKWFGWLVVIFLIVLVIFGGLRYTGYSLFEKTPVEIEFTSSPFRLIQGTEPFGKTENAEPIVLFTDYGCSDCQEFNEIVFPYLNLQFFRLGKATYYVKHYPLDSSCNEYVDETKSPNGCDLAVAMVCASQQGKFWKFHNRIVEDGITDVDSIVTYAESRGTVDHEAFKICIESDGALAIVKTDIELAHNSGVTESPSLLVKNKILSGYYDIPVFEEFVKRQMS